MEDIITMYSVDNILYSCESNPEYIIVKCPACDGSGFIELDEKYSCPKCSESGFIEKRIENYKVVKRTITSINIFITSSIEEVYYCLDSKYSIREDRINNSDSFVFNSKLKAKNRVNELNDIEKKEKIKYEE